MGEMVGKGYFGSKGMNGVFELQFISLIDYIYCIGCCINYVDVQIFVFNYVINGFMWGRIIG